MPIRDIEPAISLQDLTIALLKEERKPEDIKGIRRVTALSEIHDLVTLYFVDRHAGTVSALLIEEHYPINNEFCGVVKGEWELGGYNESHGCYYTMGTFPVTRLPPNQTFVQQARLNSDETYMEDHIRTLFGD